MTNHVIRPRNRDDEHKSVKTGRTDPLARLIAVKFTGISDPLRASGAAVLF